MTINEKAIAAVSQQKVKIFAYTQQCAIIILRYIMSIQIGTLLREERNKKGYSLQYVCEQTGITNSRLSRVETNICTKPDPDMLKELSQLYDVNIIDLYICAGYLSDKNIEKDSPILSNVERLSDEDVLLVQLLINRLIAYTKGEKNAL